MTSTRTVRTGAGPYHEVLLRAVAPSRVRRGVWAAVALVACATFAAVRALRPAPRVFASMPRVRVLPPPRPAPVPEPPVAPLDGVVQLARGEREGAWLALTRDGSLYTWGDDPPSTELTTRRSRARRVSTWAPLDRIEPALETSCGRAYGPEGFVLWSRGVATWAYHARQLSALHPPNICNSRCFGWSKGQDDEAGSEARVDEHRRFRPGREPLERDTDGADRGKPFLQVVSRCRALSCRACWAYQRDREPFTVDPPSPRAGGERATLSDATESVRIWRDTAGHVRVAAACEPGEHHYADFAVPSPPLQVPDVTELAAGHDLACATTERGAVWCWAFPPYRPEYVFDDRDYLVRRNGPHRVPLVPVTGVVAATWRGACGVARDGAAWCWRAAPGHAGRWQVAQHPWLREAVKLHGVRGNLCATLRDGRFVCDRDPRPYDAAIHTATRS